MNGSGFVDSIIRFDVNPGNQLLIHQGHPFA
jgi:hypothetical protein